jgi:hypothetical protein
MKKKNIFILMMALASVVLVTPSCKKGFTEINTDPNNSPIALPQQLLAPALVNTLTYNMMRNRNFNNELMQVSVDLSDSEGKVFRYEFRSTWSDYTWNGWYSQLANFDDLYKVAAEPVNYNTSYMGISLVCQAWIYSLLTDVYGDVPFSEAIKAKHNKIYEPKFDSQKDIYNGVFAMLDSANVLLAKNKAIEALSDPVYAGNVGRWRRFANSLHLRLLMRVSGKAEVSNDVIAKINEMVVTNPSNYPLMASNDDSAILKWTGVAPYISPYYTSVREQDFRQPALASFFMDNLLAWNDPRINTGTYGKNSTNRFGIAPGANGFVGVPSGYVPGSGEAKQSYFYSFASTFSGLPTQTLQSDPMSGQMMNVAELKFILAEAVLKGWIPGNAKTYYDDGVKFSITQWLPFWPNGTANPVLPTSTELATALATYLSNADMDWIDAETFEQKMQKIHLQKYYALFLNDFQQWFEYRRTGYPKLNSGPGFLNNGVMPARMPYPVYVQSTNPTNYKKAVAAQGADVLSTQVWWQKP